MNKKVKLYNCYKKPFGKIGLESFGTGILISKVSNNFGRVKLKDSTIMTLSNIESIGDIVYSI